MINYNAFSKIKPNFNLNIKKLKEIIFQFHTSQ
jgi:hypothetical protein